MKKFITLFVILFSAIALTSCFGELESLEWETLPKSVYAVNDEAATTFMTDVSVKINGVTVSLQDAVDDHGATVSGFNVATEGERVITVKYKSLTIYWAYRVIEEDIPSDEVTPTYDWYDNQSSPYTLASIGDLYGFANIVNGKRPDHSPHSFAGETVKLAADIDLTGKVWEPIGAAPRKLNVALDYLGQLVEAPDADHKIYFLGGKLYYTEPSKADPVQIVASEIILQGKLDSAPIKGKYYIGAYVFAEEDKEGEYEYNNKKYKFYFSSDEIVGNFFEGTFDGQGRKITGLSDVGYTPTVVLTYANSGTIVTGYTFGLFGVVKGTVTVKNINFEDFQVVGAYYQVDGGMMVAEIDSVGSAVGYAFGEGNLTLDNIKVLSGSISGSNAVGGIVGRTYCRGNVLIQNCENRANINVNEKHSGGIAGYATNAASTMFRNNTNYGNITAPSGQSGAMIRYIGVNNASVNTFDNCRNFGNISGVGAQDKIALTKGMVTSAYSNRQTFVNCVNYGALTD